MVITQRAQHFYIYIHVHIEQTGCFALGYERIKKPSWCNARGRGIDPGLLRSFG